MQKLKVDVGFCLFLACVLLLVPIKLVAAWIIAVTVHEFFHYIALKACGVKILSLRLRASGVVMKTAEISIWQEVVCALAGPFGGFFLLLTARVLPYTAICGFCQSCYNLLPIYPLDGGRALRCILTKIFGLGTANKVSACINKLTLSVISLLTVYISYRFDLPTLTFYFLGWVLIFYLRRKFPCKPS